MPLTYTLTGPNGTDLSELPKPACCGRAAPPTPGPSPARRPRRGDQPRHLTYTVTDEQRQHRLGYLYRDRGGRSGTELTRTDQTYTMGTMIPALTLPAATGGTGTLTYTLTGPNGTDLSEAAVGLLWTG